MLKISNLPKATKTNMVNWSKAQILTYDVLISDKTNRHKKYSYGSCTSCFITYILKNCTNWLKKCHFSTIWVEVDMGSVDV